MGHRIKIKVFDADITLSVTDLANAFQGKPGCKINAYSSKGETGISVICETEQGWIGIWAKIVNKDMLNIYARGSSASFYSRNGRWFLDTIEELALNHKGNLLLVAREPDTGGGRTTIIYQGEVIYGCFSKKLGSVMGHRSMWKSKYDPKLDIDEPINMTLHDVVKGTTESIRIEPA